MYTYNPIDWLLLPGGKSALHRSAVRLHVNGLATCGLVPNDASGKLRLANHAEIIAANHGAPYPWGYLPSSERASRMWKEKRIGFGGLVHKDWFVLDGEERVGGAENVQEFGPAAIRFYLLTTGGKDDALPGTLKENEGYGIVWEGVPDLNRMLYNKIHDHVARHVSADGGSVVITPALNESDTVYVGFIGRCMTCPNPERISIKALQLACPEINIKLHPDWENWTL